MPPFTRKKVVKAAPKAPEPTVADLWKATSSVAEGDSPAVAQGTLAAIAYNAQPQPVLRFGGPSPIQPSEALLAKWAAEEQA